MEHARYLGPDMGADFGPAPFDPREPWTHDEYPVVREQYACNNNAYDPPSFVRGASDAIDPLAMTRKRSKGEELLHTLYGPSQGDYEHLRRQDYSARTPPHYQDQAYHDGYDYGYVQAPMLQSRNVQVPVPQARAEPLCVAPTEPGPARDAVHLAFSRWYARFIFTALLEPGFYRRGEGGAATELWGPMAREKESWLRTGWSPMSGVPPWTHSEISTLERMAPIRGPASPRDPHSERHDPYNLLYQANDDPIYAPLADFVHNMVKRMSISPSSIMHAAWFVCGLGLHEGDGDKGAKLRRLLVEWYWFEGDRHAVAKRVAMLGLLLAGKWLDDNAFATRSYLEVTGISIMHIDLLERTALQDLHHSLFVPVEAWTQYVAQIRTGLVEHGDALDDMDSVVLAMVDHMVQEAHDALAKLPKKRSVCQDTLSPFLQQCISPDSSRRTRRILADAWQEFDVPMRPSHFQDEAELQGDYEEWLEYDGAKQWLSYGKGPRRSSSDSSDGVECLDDSIHSSVHEASHTRMTSLPHTPGPVFASRAVSPEIVAYSRQPSEGSAHGLPGATDHYSVPTARHVDHNGGYGLQPEGFEPLAYATGGGKYREHQQQQQHHSTAWYHGDQYQPQHYAQPWRQSGPTYHGNRAQHHWPPVPPLPPPIQWVSTEW